jgi:hypothetical protein
MSNKANGVNWDRRFPAKQKRKGVIERLEKQLKDGVKNTTIMVGKKYPTKQSATIPLTDSDIKRINKELEVLKTRI